MEPELEVLKSEVIHYIQQLWSHATRRFEEHLGEPIDKFKMWFEAVGDEKVRKENEELKRTMEDLQKQLEVERNVALGQLECDVEESRDKQKAIVHAEKQDVEPHAELEVEKSKATDDEVNQVNEAEDVSDQGIVDPRSAYGSSH